MMQFTRSLMSEKKRLRHITIHQMLQKNFLHFAMQFILSKRFKIIIVWL